MIANFFQSLDRNQVEYLLISGQATVLYGAATFSEDIDLWLNPVEKNRDHFSELQLADRRYWRNIIRELKELRASNKLMPKGKTILV
jgi:hypothetical protein